MAFVKVKFAGKKRPIYLEQAKQITKGGLRFISGYQVNPANGESTIHKGGSILHLIQLGEGVTVVPQIENLMYGNLEDAKLPKVTIRQNAWGNWYGYVGGRKVAYFMNSPTETMQQQAERWLKEQLAGGAR